MDTAELILKTVMIACFSLSGILIILRVLCTIICRLYTCNRSEWKSLVPWTVLIRETIRYTNDILVMKRIDQFPNFRVRYYQHSSHSGIFTGEVVVYLKNHGDIPDIVDTTLHEVMHFIQSRSSKEYRYYDHYTQVHGYWNNPLEIEARAFAEKHCRACLQHLESKGIIKRT